MTGHTEALLPCPFCGATPHRGLTKPFHDQMHGEILHHYRIWCPHDCASKRAVNEDQAIAAWNTRTGGVAQAAVSREDADLIIEALNMAAGRKESQAAFVKHGRHHDEKAQRMRELRVVINALALSSTDRVNLPGHDETMANLDALTISSTPRCTCAAIVNPNIPHARFCPLSSTDETGAA